VVVVGGATPVLAGCDGWEADVVVFEWVGVGDEEHAANTSPAKVNAPNRTVYRLVAPLTRSVWRTPGHTVPWTSDAPSGAD